MRKVISKIAGTLLGFSLVLGVGIAFSAHSKKEVINSGAAAGDTITYTITQSTVTNYPSSYSDTEVEWSQNNDGGTIEMHFALAQHIKNSTNMQSKANVGYFRNTDIPDGYAIKSIQITNGSGTARTWTLYGSDDVLTTSNYSTATKVSNSYTSGAAAVAYGSGTTYTTSGYPYSYFYAARGANAQYSSSYIITLIKLEESTAKLQSVSVAGTLSKDEYTTAESWSADGLIVTAHYDDSSSKTVTGSSEWAFDPATPKAGGSGTYSVRFTASFGGFSGYVDKQVTVTKAAEYALVTDATKLTKGTKAIFVSTGTYNTNTYTRALADISGNAATNYFNVATVELSDSFNEGSVAVSASATVFTLGGSAGAWTLTDGDTKQVAFTGTSNNNVTFNATNKDSFTITSGSGNIVTVNSNSQSGRGLRYNVNSGSPRFSNYTSGGQAAIYMFADIAEASYGTTNHIEVATLPETEFAVGDTFTSAGIAVNAWDSADDSGNSKPVTSFTTTVSGSPSTPFDDDDVGPHTVTVTYTENATDFTDTYSIYVYAAATYELVDEEPSDWSGSYLITVDIETATTAMPETGTYAMKASLDNFDVIGNFSKVQKDVDSVDGTTITAGQHLQWSIASVSGGYSLQGHSGKYIGWNDSSKNGMTTSASALVNTISISGSDVTILCSAGTRGLTLSSASGQFRYYQNAVVHLYRLRVSDNADSYAQLFLNAFTCDSTGENAPTFTVKEGSTYWSWSLLEDEYDNLTPAEKEQFRLGNPSKTGSNIEQAIARYDLVVSKYGWDNFMSRTITSGAPYIQPVTNSNASTIIIVVVALTSITSIGVLLVIKRKRSLVK